MSVEQWEKKVLRVPEAEQRVRAVENELRTAQDTENAVVAQLVERPPRKRRVAGSSPARGPVPL